MGAEVEAPRQRWPINVGLVRAQDRDYRDLKGESITMPVVWHERIEASAARATAKYEIECDRFDVTTQLVRWSLEQAEGVAPQPEGIELAGPKRTTSMTLSRRLWGLLRAEAERRGLSLNRAFQCHLLRGLKADEAADGVTVPAPRKPKRQ